MTIMPEPDRRHGPLPRDGGPARSVSIERGPDAAHQGKRFLEHARIDPRRANILIQLAESVGDRIDSLPRYIDMLLAIISVPANEHEKYSGWFAELATLERSL